MMLDATVTGINWKDLALVALTINSCWIAYLVSCIAKDVRKGGRP